MMDFLSSINANCINAIVLSATTICSINISTANNLITPVVCGTTSVRSPLISGNTICSIGSLGNIGIDANGAAMTFSRTSVNYFNAISAGGQFAWRVSGESTNAMTLDSNSNLGIVGNVSATCFIGSGAGLTGTASSLTVKNSTCLNGQTAAYYQPASTAINTSNIGSQSVSYASTAGSAPANGGTANNSTCLNGQLASFYQAASTAINTTNISTQSVKNSTCLGGQTAGYYQPASTAITTDNISSQSVNNSGCLGGKIYTLYQGLAEGASNVDPNTTTSLYILTNHANSPSTLKYWHIRTQYYSTIGSTSNRAQIAIEYNPSTYSRMFVRTYYSTGWNSWIESVNTDNIGTQSVAYATFAGYSTQVCSSSHVAVQPYASSCVQLYYAGVAKFKTLTNGACITGCGFATDFIASSDRFLKKDIQPISNALSIINRLCGVCYHMCDDVNNENRVGLIAQDVESVLPEIVSYSEPSEDDKKYGIRDKKLGLKYDKLTAVLLEAIKEQQLQINYLHEEINIIKKSLI